MVVSEVLGCDRCAKRGRLRPALGAAERSYPTSRVRGCDERNYPVSKVRGCWEELPHAPKPKARGGGREDQRHARGALAAWTQEGIEELFHVEGQEGQR